MSNICFIAEKLSFCQQKVIFLGDNISSSNISTDKNKINAIKFFFEQVLHRPKMFFDIPRPKKPISPMWFDLPVVE